MADQSGTEAADGAPVQPAQRRRGLAGACLHVAQSNWVKLRNMVRGLKRLGSLAKQDEAEFKAEATAAIQDARTGESRVQLSVSNARDLGRINYLQQGNEAMYTPEALEARHNVRRDKRVQDALHDWWMWLPKGNSPRRGRTADAPPTESTGIVRGVYCAMVVLIQLVLLPRFNVRPDPDYDPSDDWEEDCKGEQVMLYPDFFDALFELADMWCDGVDAWAYAELLSSLLRDAQALETQKGTFTQLLKRFGWPSAEDAPASPTRPVSQPSPRLRSAPVQRTNPRGAPVYIPPTYTRQSFYPPADTKETIAREPPRLNSGSLGDVPSSASAHSSWQTEFMAKLAAKGKAKTTKDAPTDAEHNAHTSAIQPTSAQDTRQRKEGYGGHATTDIDSALANQCALGVPQRARSVRTSPFACPVRGSMRTQTSHPHSPRSPRHMEPHYTHVYTGREDRTPGTVPGTVPLRAAHPGAQSGPRVCQSARVTRSDHMVYSPRSPRGWHSSHRSPTHSSPHNKAPTHPNHHNRQQQHTVAHGVSMQDSAPMHTAQQPPMHATHPPVQDGAAGYENTMGPSGQHAAPGNDDSPDMVANQPRAAHEQHGSVAQGPDGDTACPESPETGDWQVTGTVRDAEESGEGPGVSGGPDVSLCEHTMRPVTAPTAPGTLCRPLSGGPLLLTSPLTRHISPTWDTCGGTHDNVTSPVHLARSGQSPDSPLRAPQWAAPPTPPDGLPSSPSSRQHSHRQSLNLQNQRTTASPRARPRSSYVPRTSEAAAGKQINATAARPRSPAKGTTVVRMAVWEPLAVNGSAGGTGCVSVRSQACDDKDTGPGALAMWQFSRTALPRSTKGPQLCSKYGLKHQAYSPSDVLSVDVACDKGKSPSFTVLRQVAEAQGVSIDKAAEIWADQEAYVLAKMPGLAAWNGRATWHL